MQAENSSLRTAAQTAIVSENNMKQQMMQHETKMNAQMAAAAQLAANSDKDMKLAAQRAAQEKKEMNLLDKQIQTEQIYKK